MFSNLISIFSLRKAGSLNRMVVSEMWLDAFRWPFLPMASPGVRGWGHSISNIQVWRQNHLVMCRPHPPAVKKFLNSFATISKSSLETVGGTAPVHPAPWRRHWFLHMRNKKWPKHISWLIKYLSLLINLNRRIKWPCPNCDLKLTNGQQISAQVQWKYHQ